MCDGSVGPDTSPPIRPPFHASQSESVRAPQRQQDLLCCAHGHFPRKISQMVNQLADKCPCYTFRFVPANNIPTPATTPTAASACHMSGKCAVSCNPQPRTANSSL